MTAQDAVSKIEAWVSRCKYSTMKHVKYVALACDIGYSVMVENSDTIWIWIVKENKPPLLKQLIHKNKKSTNQNSTESYAV
jgi:hypothetical protein